MKRMWCWRCQMMIPMLDEQEYDLVEEAMRKGPALVEAERQRRNLPTQPAIQSPYTQDPRLLAMLEMYRLLTGLEETVPAAIGHHRISLYGPPCPVCDRPLRTPLARFCAACGFGQGDLSEDSPPLVVRKPEEFRTDPSL